MPSAMTRSFISICRPARTAASPSAKRRSTVRISMTVCSATCGALTPWLLQTGMPRAFAASMSMAA